MGLLDRFKKKPESVLTETDLRWNRFIEEVCSRELSELSNLQRNAVLCFWYDAEMNNGGHCSYLDCHEEVEPQQLTDAILAVGYQEIADNFKKAVADGEKDDWAETDHAYYAFSPTLFDCLREYVERHKDVMFE